MTSSDASFGNVECEYQLLAQLAACPDIESLDATLERVLGKAFSGQATILQPDSSQNKTQYEHLQNILIANNLDEVLRQVVISESRSSPLRRFLDAVLNIYTSHYELLLKCQLDKLTGLYNRQVLDEKIKSLNTTLEYQERRDNDIHRVIALIDIDHFKSINDNYGHSYGDEVLVILAYMMKKAFRLDDWLFRYGGEEFLVILNNIDLGNAATVINRFIAEVANHYFPQIGRVTVSAGFSRYDPQKAFSTSLDEADKALYFAKSNGRNQQHCYSDLVTQGAITPIDRGSEIDLF